MISSEIEAGETGEGKKQELETVPFCSREFFFRISYVKWRAAVTEWWQKSKL